jgi:DNA polymerase III alpha subunit
MSSEACLKTTLADRTLWYDGDSSYTPPQIIPAMLGGHNVRWVSRLTDEVSECNRRLPSAQQLKVKSESRSLNMDWNIPLEYQSMDVVEHIVECHNVMTSHTSEQECLARDRRLAEELIKFDAMGLMDVLRAMVYITDRLYQENVIYGVGRGSSVSSYALYIIGVHDVDSFKYGLDMNDFVHQ